jgi:BlaI family penicillinase repressor
MYRPEETGMKGTDHAKLSRRERQIMDIIFELGQATAAEVLQKLADPPSYSAVRAMLRILEEKSHLKHHQVGPRYVYQPTVSRQVARDSAIERVVRTFFDGSTEQAMAALLDLSSAQMAPDELDRLQQMIDQARKAGR